MAILFNSERYPNKEITKAPQAPVLGEAVLMYKEGLECTQWRLGRVREIIKSSDRQIRGVVLKVNYNSQSYTLRRPIQCLYPLEVAQQTVPDDLLPNQVLQILQDAEQDISTSDLLEQQLCKQGR